jgi:hypothetical protein
MLSQYFFKKMMPSWISYSQTIFLLGVQIVFRPIESIWSTSTRFKFFLLEKCYLCLDIFFYVKKIDSTHNIAQTNDLIVTKYECLNFKIRFRYLTLCLKFELYNFKLIYLWVWIKIMFVESIFWVVCVCVWTV